MLAGQEERAARQRSEAWSQRAVEQYSKAITSGNPREIEALEKLTRKLEDKADPDRKALVLWYAFQANVTFFTVLVALTLQEWLLSGRTLGKRIFNLRTISIPSTNPPSLTAALSRSALKAIFITLPIFNLNQPIVLNVYLAMLILLGIVNFHVPLFRRDKRAWHDLWTRTQVVDERQA